MTALAECPACRDVVEVFIVAECVSCAEVHLDLRCSLCGYRWNADKKEVIYDKPNP